METLRFNVKAVQTGTCQSEVGAGSGSGAGAGAKTNGLAPLHCIKGTPTGNFQICF
jgi:hypothetical protein